VLGERAHWTRLKWRLMLTCVVTILLENTRILFHGDYVSAVYCLASDEKREVTVGLLKSPFDDVSPE
jgi:hypothetical protein